MTNVGDHTGDVLNATQPVLLYDVEESANALDKEMYGERFAKVQRWGALWVVSV